MAIAALLVSTAAHAQSAPRAIAYATANSKGDSVYLVDSDGSGQTKIYSGKSTSRFGSPITDIALRLETGGGEVAFIENRVLKVQNHGADGQPIGPAYPVSIPQESSQCPPFDIDYRTDGTLLVATSCNNVWTVGRDQNTAASAALISAQSLQAIAAIGNSLLYVDWDAQANGHVLKLRNEAGSTTIFTPKLNNPFLRLDATSVTAFLSDKSAFQTAELTSPIQVEAGCTQGGYVAVSADGSEMIYLYRNELLLHNSNCSGRTPSRIARGVRSFAWRAN